MPACQGPTSKHQALSSSVSNRLQQVLAGADVSVDDGDADDTDGLSSRGTLAEATVVLRWERLVGRLAATSAQRKALLLLQWLQLHLAFTEGCSSSGRGTWLSHKVSPTR